MTESEFIDRWRKEGPIYAAWGRFVAGKLSDAIQGRVAPTKLELFLKLPVIPRVKDEVSLLQKAFYRNKNYENPYEDIEDKVGLRFVVLLTDDIRTIESALNDQTDWIATLARDFEHERDARPYEFDYQSLHYIVRSSAAIDFEGVAIPYDLPCEIQIRTLLQHAYGELTHDTIYKPNVRATPKLKRAAAKSMALIEATSDYFSSVNKVIQAILADTKKLSEFLAAKYATLTTQATAESPLNSLLIDHYKSFVGVTFENDFEKWWRSKSYLESRISERAQSAALYRTPAVLLVYFCVSSAPVRAKQDSPLTDNELQLIYSDLGLALNGQ
jgi:ppGpp synthetase/RelA/SpoT-type nucleotidyltranferase